MALHIDELLPTILGRQESFLREEIESSGDQISEALAEAKVLVIGAAGSIGAAFVRVLARYAVRGLHLVDISENNLVEVVRDFRSSGADLPEEFRTYSIDYSGPEMDALLRAESYDYVFNFSALKHVRSERDPYTLMRLLEVNVLANRHMLDELKSSSRPARAFCVSSDKAVRPASLMGASKAFMERVFLSQADEIPFCSARFANVAFSDGSLLHSFIQRLDHRQPISAPSDVRRYFITHEEAGQLCLLGGFTGNNREIYFPKFRPESDMMTFAEIAKVFLDAHGYTALECETEEEARARASELCGSSTSWPCHFTASDTSGEKEFEEFYDPRETTDLQRFPQVGVVTEPIFEGAERIEAGIERILAIRKSGRWNKADLVEAVQLAIPELEHVERERNLDQKM